MGRGIAQDQPVDPLGRVDSEPLPDESTERQAKEMHVLQVEGVEQLDDVASEPVERIGANRNARSSMAAEIVAQNSEILREFVDLPIPHVQRGADGVGQYQHG